MRTPTSRQEAGRRIVAIGTTTSTPRRTPGDGPPPAVPLGLAVLAEELRPDARETIAYLQDEGVDVKVLSGDAPRTVGSIAADAGIFASTRLVLRRTNPAARIPSDRR